MIQLIGDACASLVVRGEQVQRFALPAEVLHELGRQFHRIPGNTIDAGDGAIVDPRQHVVQAVAEFVEQGLDLIMRE